MKKMKYYEETSALLHEFSEENQKYFEELWESFNLAGFLYDEDYLREQIYLMMLDFSEAERDGMSAEDYLGKNPKKIMKEILKGAPRSSIKESLLTPILVLAVLRYYQLLSDFSKDYIIKSVDGILQRLKIDHLDSLLLHRPDALMESDQVAEAFNLLYKQGKVRDFGVSNQNPMMMELLKKDVKQPLAVNQLQLSAAFTPGFESAFHVNMEDSQAAMRDGSIFEYCQLHDVVIQAWSVLQFGYFKGNFVGNEKFQALNQVLDRLAIKYGVTSSTIAISWILRYPAKMQAVVGTTNPKHLREVSQAANFSLTRKEWYEIYLAAGNNLP